MSECGAIPPNVGGPAPCHLEPGHAGPHFSTSGCRGSEIRWSAERPSAEEVEAAARGIHAKQEYTTCWDDNQSGAESRMGTPMRPLGEHGREFYRGLARAALVAVREAGK